MNSLHLIAWPLFTSLLLSFLIEQFLIPKPLLPWERPISTTIIHIGTCIALFAFCLLLVRRPWFSITIILVFQLFLLLVSQAKYQSLHEAFFFQDFEYFTDAIKNPRLYLPFFGITRTIGAIVGITGAIILGINLETALVYTYPLISLCIVLFLTGLFLIRFSLRHIPTTKFDPNDDLQQLGQLAFFWKYRYEEQETVIDYANSPFANKLARQAQKRPDIIVVQSESFFDPRLHFNQIKPTILTNYDLILDEACHYGRLNVPAWGANTVRTECGFLTGLPPEQMGVHRFNPYRFLATQRIPNLVNHLKAIGYQTICIHPYPVSFYQRDMVFPGLGFDQFLDIKEFNKQQKSGQYIGDLAVSEKINELLENKNDKPLFIFSITMENHGPLHLEQPSTSEYKSYFKQKPSEQSNDLIIYLRHLKNADLMIKNLKEGLQKSDREALLCWYGDHVPIMEKVYELSGIPDGQTNYFIWQSTTQTQLKLSNKQDLAVHNLASLMLENTLLF